MKKRALKSAKLFHATCKTGISFKGTGQGHRRARGKMGDMNGTNKRDAKPKAKEDPQAVKLVNKSGPETRNSTESLVVLCRKHNISRGLSFSKLEVALMIAVAILAILLTVFFALYCTAVRKGKAHSCQSCLELVEYRGRGNESGNFTDGRRGEFPLDDREKTDTWMGVTGSKKNDTNGK